MSTNHREQTVMTCPGNEENTTIYMWRNLVKVNRTIAHVKKGKVAGACSPDFIPTPILYWPNTGIFMVKWNNCINHWLFSFIPLLNQLALLSLEHYKNHKLPASFSWILSWCAMKLFTHSTQWALWWFGVTDCTTPPFPGYCCTTMVRFSLVFTIQIPHTHTQDDHN